MSIEQEKLEKFERTVYREAEHKIEEIKREIEEYRKQELDKSTDQTLEDCFNTIQTESAKIRHDCRKKVAREEINARRDLLIAREKLAGQVFQNVRDRLLAYTSSDEYPAFLIKAVEKAAALYRDEVCVLYLKENDLSLANQLQPFFQKVTFEPSDDITIGGFMLKVESKGVFLDETLDFQLESQKGYFHEISHLSVE